MDRELEPLLRILEKIEFTASLDASIQRELARYMRFLSVQPGTVIFSQGDVGDLFYIILSGGSLHHSCTQSRVDSWAKLVTS